MFQLCTCEARGANLTELRRRVLGLVLAAGKPAGAYDLLGAMRAHHKAAAPPTVYRALEFLLEQGLVHKVESLSAIVGCAHGDEGPHAPHAAQFLICDRCGRAEETSDPRLGRALGAVATAGNFTVLRATIEAHGVCGVCRDASAPAPVSAAPG